MVDGSKSSSTETPLVTVVMPVRNESGFIRRSLGSVLAQDYPADRMEILIADGMSTDGTREVIHEIGENRRVRIIDNHGRIAPTGLNRAYQQAKGSVFVRIDGHCIVTPAYVSRCVNLLQKHNCEGVGGPIETIGVSWMSRSISVAMSSVFGVGGSAFRVKKDREMWADTIPFPAYTREAVAKVGLYDEELVRNQDDEYNARLRKAGGRLLLSPELTSQYFSRSSLCSMARQYFQYGLWKVRVLQKHPRQMRWRHFVPAFFVLAQVSTILASLSGLISAIYPLSLIVAYFLALILGTLCTCHQFGWSHAILLPAIFTTIHLSYGTGFIMGLIKFWNRWTDKLGRTPSLRAGT